MPTGAADCHVHVFGTDERYPPSPSRAYTPMEASAEELWATLGAAGVSRSVLVQPSAYGTDNSCLIDALCASGGRSKGIAAIDLTIGEAELKRLHKAGVCGVRMNLVTIRRPDRETPKAIRTMVERVAPFGWHVQIFIGLAAVDTIASVIEEAAVQFVFDHMGLPIAGEGMEQPGMRTLIGLLKDERCWVKLTAPYKVSPHAYGDNATDRVARELIAANPHRVVWGSDWPHVGKFARRVDENPPRVGFRQISYGRMLGVLARWAGSEQSWRRILVDNPRRLYGFAPRDGQLAQPMPLEVGSAAC